MKFPRKLACKKNGRRQENGTREVTRARVAQVAGEAKFSRAEKLPAEEAPVPGATTGPPGVKTIFLSDSRGFKLAIL